MIGICVSLAIIDSKVIGLSYCARGDGRSWGPQFYYTEKSYQINPKSDCIYHFPVDLEPKGRPFGSKSIGE